MSSPNVLLVVLDSVRAQNTSLHESRHETTPFLSDFASRTATHYSQARAPSQWSLPSHTSMFTGLHVPEHGVTSADDRIRSGETVFDELADRGYETGLFSENPYLTTVETGLASGFDTVEGADREPFFEGVDADEYKGDVGGFLRAAVESGRPVRSLANGVVSKLAWDYPRLLPDRFERRLGSGTVHGSTYTDLFRAWVDDRTGPWAACINYMDAHHPYLPTQEFDRWNDGTIASIQQSIDSMPLGFYSGADPWWKCELLEYLYDGTIRQIDHEVERLVDCLRSRGEFENTLVIITSDHGEGFGERSFLRDLRIAGHNVGETEVNLHVPLVISYPDRAGDETVDQLVSLTAIPRAIRSTIEGDPDPRGLTELPVLARTQGVLEPQREQLREEGVGLERFVGETSVLYEPDGHAVRKEMSWADRRQAVSCIDAHTAYVNRNDEADRVETVFNELEDAGVREESEAVDEDVERRLRDLGYR